VSIFCPFPVFSLEYNADMIAPCKYNPEQISVIFKKIDK